MFSLACLSLYLFAYFSTLEKPTFFTHILPLFFSPHIFLDIFSSIKTILLQKNPIIFWLDLPIQFNKVWEFRDRKIDAWLQGRTMQDIVHCSILFSLRKQYVNDNIQNKVFILVIYGRKMLPMDGVGSKKWVKQRTPYTNRDIFKKKATRNHLEHRKWIQYCVSLSVKKFPNS